MANNGVFKTLGPNDFGDSKASLHEQIPVTGTIISGTYGTFPSESNVKYFNTGDHVDLYDYPHASSSANFMFSMTAGRDVNATIGGAASTQATIKNNIYRQFAQQYVGYDTDQSVVPFNASGVLNPTGIEDAGDGASGDRFSDAIFIDFSRVLMKDEIKKGSFQIAIGTASYNDPFSGIKTLSDAHVVEGNQQTFKTNSPMGEYALLQNGTTATVPSTSSHGLLYYQAGLLVLFPNTSTFGSQLISGSLFGLVDTTLQPDPREAMLSASVSDIVNGARAHIQNIQFNNTTELNSTTYFLRAANNEFNYSNNPSFVTGSEIIVKAGNAGNPSVAYITTVGLYSADNQLLAVGKLSEPLKKTPQDELNIKMRIDY
tara:strand:- start:1078 stop:2196 length:1119 start_codon:yes stop_codon:yes gene_type:complete